MGCVSRACGASKSLKNLGCLKWKNSSFGAEMFPFRRNSVDAHFYFHSNYLTNFLPFKKIHQLLGVKFYTYDEVLTTSCCHSSIFVQTKSLNSSFAMRTTRAPTTKMVSYNGAAFDSPNVMNSPWKFKNMTFGNTQLSTLSVIYPFDSFSQNKIRAVGTSPSPLHPVLSLAMQAKTYSVISQPFPFLKFFKNFESIQPSHERFLSRASFLRHFRICIKPQTFSIVQTVQDSHPFSRTFVNPDKDNKLLIDSRIGGIRKHFSHNQHHHPNPEHNHDFPGNFNILNPKENNSGSGAFWITKIGLFSDTFLSIGKVIAGYFSGSSAIIADAVHSISDIFISGISLISVKIGRVPRDDNHPYGHGKFETVGGLAISSLLIFTSLGISYHSIVKFLSLVSSSSKLTQPNDEEHGHGFLFHSHDLHLDENNFFIALSMMIISIGVKESLYWITKKVGEREKNNLLIANALHHRSDSLSSFFALVGIGGAMAGFPYFDPASAFLVSLMILKESFFVAKRSLQELVDTGLSEELLPIRKVILGVDGVRGCHLLRGRRAGSFIYIDVHIEVNPWLSVISAHEIGSDVRKSLQKTFPHILEATIHIDPFKDTK